jgi:hypothetical protein
MNVRLNQAIVGQHFVFQPRQIVECSEAQAAGLIKAGIASRVADDAPADGRMIEDTPEEIEQAKIEKRARFLIGQTHSREARAELKALRREAPERADLPERETPEDRAEGGVCQGKTAAGFACKRKALPGKRFCEKHTDEI